MFFWSKRWQQSDVSKLTDLQYLSLLNLIIYCLARSWKIAVKDLKDFVSFFAKSIKSWLSAKSASANLNQLREYFFLSFNTFTGAVVCTVQSFGEKITKTSRAQHKKVTVGLWCHEIVLKEVLKMFDKIFKPTSHQLEVFQ